MKHILVNRIRTPDGTILESRHRHDYVTYVDDNGLEYMVDGGKEYLRRNLLNGSPYEELSVYFGDSHVLVREAFKWGTRGIDGNKEVVFKTLSLLETDHIEAIIESQYHLTDEVRGVFLDEIYYRREK